MIGHSSVTTTERYYAPWNTARRDRLVRIVKEVHEHDPMLRNLTERMLKKKTGAVDAIPTFPLPRRRLFLNQQGGVPLPLDRSIELQLNFLLRKCEGVGSSLDSHDSGTQEEIS